mmetsp:Transcript_1806/g.3293  ORF Transcript_1806/g.3293 Transcript_1806/m.3293 type:complete len:115 (-) Transcript_1806:563-907(-)
MFKVYWSEPPAKGRGICQKIGSKSVGSDHEWSPIEHTGSKNIPKLIEYEFAFENSGMSTDEMSQDQRSCFSPIQVRDPATADNFVFVIHIYEESGGGNFNAFLASCLALLDRPR